MVGESRNFRDISSKPSSGRLNVVYGMLNFLVVSRFLRK